MYDIPYLSNYINLTNAVINPSTVHDWGNTQQRFFARYLTQKAMSVFKWTVPETWESGLNFMLYCLYLQGHFAVIKTDKFGVIPLNCNLGGYTVFYQPAWVDIANPLINGSVRRLQIDKQCVLFKLTPDYCGIADLIDFYSQLMSLVVSALAGNVLNSRLAYVFTAGNKAGAESFKKLFDKILSGEPAAVADKSLFDDEGNAMWQAFTQNVGQNFISPDLMVILRNLEQEFDRKIGLPNANIDKRERLITDEVNITQVETHSMIDMWLENLRKSCMKCAAMFGINVRVDLREDLFYNKTEVDINE